ncbi:hypothetical protein Awo_c31910 [Acetobacterium woodii DSM 1030]|uniref:Uncharacterized protein n=1 Tax=Acetobacterium woodii (strain ATCC 29683 / DSM 1030 / JCM 2381 / KCTC 1655 / WB1) TaxID=931626 RepID=H6LJJ1_ACEWD|nr:hypothetical protein Awo_c31910 [Acetobacterium woodii DSM 1030]
MKKYALIKNRHPDSLIGEWDRGFFNLNNGSPQFLSHFSGILLNSR